MNKHAFDKNNHIVIVGDIILHKCIINCIEVTPVYAPLSDFGVTERGVIAQRKDSYLFNPYF